MEYRFIAGGQLVDTIKSLMIVLSLAHIGMAVCVYGIIRNEKNYRYWLKVFISFLVLAAIIFGALIWISSINVQATEFTQQAAALLRKQITSGMIVGTVALVITAFLLYKKRPTE